MGEDLDDISDEDLEALRKELKKEREKHITEEPVPPQPNPEKPPQPRPEEPPHQPQQQKPVQPETAESQIQWGAPPQTAQEKPASGKPKPETRTPTVQPPPQPPAPETQTSQPTPPHQEKPPETQPPEPPPKPQKPTPQTPPQDEKPSAPRQPDKSLTWSQPAKQEVPSTAETTARPSLEPEDVADRPRGKRKPPGTPILNKMVFLIILAVVAAGAFMAAQMLIQPQTRYQCWDGSWVEDTTLCPATTTTTTASTSTTATLPPVTLPPQTTTTATLKVNCLNNSMCEQDTEPNLFCDGKYVKAPVVQYRCMHPGTPESYCVAAAAAPKLVETCKDSEYCWLGECYPEHCRNKIRDYEEGEVKIDCGGACRSCNSTDPVCNADSDCGVDVCGTPYCNTANNPTNNCTRHVCLNPGQPNATCIVRDTVEILEVCGRGRICIEGQDDCMEGPPGAGNCHDCIQNQGELRVDCGGPCQPCAYRPVEYDTLNLTATDTRTYRGYELKLDRLILEMEEKCTNGAYVTVKDPYGYDDRLRIDRWQSAEFYDIQFGLLRSDTSTATIWITHDIRT